MHFKDTGDKTATNIAQDIHTFYWEAIIVNQMQNMRVLDSKGNESFCASPQRPAHIGKNQQTERRTALSRLSARHIQAKHICAALTLDAPQQQQQGIEQLAPQLHALGGSSASLQL